MYIIIIIYKGIHILKHSSRKTTDMILIALFSAIIAAGAFVSIPFAVPFTLQSFAIFCSLLILGGKRGFVSVLVYVLVGLAGVPVFSGFKGGVGVLGEITGGYIIGFVAASALFVLLEKLYKGKKGKTAKALFLLAWLFVCYLFAVLWYSFVYSQGNISSALIVCVLPFIVTDIIKLLVAVFFSEKIVNILKITIDKSHM